VEKTSAETLKVPALLESIQQDDVMNKMKRGWKIKTVRISEEYPYSLYQQEQGSHAVPLISINNLRIIIHATEGILPTESGYTLIAFTPPANIS